MDLQPDPTGITGCCWGIWNFFPFRRNQGEGQGSWASSGSTMARAVGAHLQKRWCQSLSLGSVRRRSDYPASCLRPSASGTTMIWPELQLPLMQLSSGALIPPARLSVCQGGPALAGVGEGQAWGVSLFRPSSGLGRLLLQASCSVDTLWDTPAPHRRASTEENPRPSLSTGPVASDKDLVSCLYLEPTVGACLEAQRAWAVQGEWLPQAEARVFSLHGFSGSANTGDPGGKLVCQRQVVPGLASASLGVKR